MRDRVSMCAALVSAALLAAACDNDEARDSAGLASAAPTSIQFSSLAVEPLSIPPEFLPSQFCPTRPPFRGALTVILRSGDEAFLRTLRFSFIDQLGRRVIPTVTVSGTTFSTIPTAGPLPLPSSPPLPVPGVLEFQGIPITPSVPRTVPVSAVFDCGVAALGTLFISAETRDGEGRTQTSQTSVRIGR
jgi:hypothetical protein